MAPGTLDRRDALRLCLVGAGAGWLGCNRGSGTGPADAPSAEPASPLVPESSARDDGALDEALRLIHRQEPNVRAGLSTHAPMAVEALCALGFGDRAVGWVNQYDRSERQLPPPTQPIDRGAWRAALGPRRGAGGWEDSLPRWADWKELFERELREARWSEVLDLWVGRLSPGLSAAATHGIIRTAHAARSLARRDTPERRGELARGLGYWAAAYEELPSRPAAARATTLREALERLPLYRDRHGDAPGGSIADGLRAVAALEGFADAKELVALPADTAAAVTAVTGTFARAYLQHGTSHISALAFVHSVTSANALRRIAEHVRPETARAALPFLWQATAAIYTGYATRGAAAREPETKRDPKELASLAATHGDEHVIKFTDALLEEHAIARDPVLLAAAEDAVGSRFAPPTRATGSR
jgi:hypothetical protein